ncbi:MAG: hypothetical protein QOJ19_342 [Acidimicrobiia bacterium]|nr:hypothetical protein [Acidimicrobiia bacterium]
MTLRRLSGLFTGAVLLGLATLAWRLAASAGAHPLGNFTVNHYAGLHVSARPVRVDYVLDLPGENRH